MIRHLTAGESHGKQLDIIIDGFPSNFKLDIERINQDLAKRQIKVGSGKRMSIETDKVIVNAGIMNQKTTGAPLSFSIKNLDYSNWIGKKIEPYVIPRPGHADFSGVNKYGLDDIRPIIERASARETATRVILGSCCMQMLEKLGITIDSYVVSVAGKDRGKNPSAYKLDVEEAKQRNDTIGGKIKTKITGVPVGLGSHVQSDRRLDAKIAFAVMSVPSVKGIEFGAGYDLMYMTSSSAQKCTGGIDGGMSNGKEIEFDCCLKPIPTTLKPQKSINLITNRKAKTAYERSDIAPIFRAPIIISSVVAPIILNEIFDVYGCSDDWNRLKYISRKCGIKKIFNSNQHQLNNMKKEFWKNEQ